MIFRKMKKRSKEFEYDSGDTTDDSKRRKLFGVFSSKDCRANRRKKGRETSLQYLRRILRLDVALTAWDFDSTTLAYQLTLIDRDLFIKIPPIELGVLLWQQSSKNAPNIGAFIAFSHRISCLVTTEILKDDNEKIRARLITRFINTAYKCNSIGNLQTCKSILCGLQSVPIYRLQNTWAYVRNKHASKYMIFEHLCRTFRDPRLPIYQDHVKIIVSNGAYIPYIGDIIFHLLDRIHDVQGLLMTSNGSRSALKYNFEPKGSDIINRGKKINLLKKLISTIKEWPTNQNEYSKQTKRNLRGSLSAIKKSGNICKIQNYRQENRPEKLNEAIRLLEKHQKAAANYCISINELARDYLLKARYREEKENFFISLHVENSKSLTNT